MDDPIIEAPELQRPGQRVGSALLTLVFWAVWIYLWLPVISAVAWWLGLRTVYYEMVVLEGYASLLDVLKWYGVIILAISLVMLGWSLMNLLRFRGRDQRRRVRSAAPEQVAAYFGRSASEVRAWQRAGRLVVDVDQVERIAGVEVDPPSEHSRVRPGPH
ncbi:MAG: poly-beta-1,6-N-acetyl-D-glucosamine biosynthesis protein PgaD [Gammaproteobacteria bacterium]|nr:poly-beta-1,6-N-acetyl-D-glucosamine biosynthesis protein PgaD [Gammaproteobacteria bacterium]